MTGTTSLPPTLYCEGCPDPQDLDRCCNNPCQHAQQPPQLIPPPQAADGNLNCVSVTRDRRSCPCHGKARAPALPIPPCEKPKPPARGRASAHIRAESCRRYPCRAPALPNLVGRQPASDGSGCSGWRGQCAGHRNGSAPIRGTAARG